MIPLAQPVLGDEEVAAAREAILSGWVTQGPKVKEFEDAFAATIGAQHACAVSNCTAALHLSLLVIGVKPGDIVLTVSHSFIGTANSVRNCGAEPAFIDIDPATFNLCPQALSKFLNQECELRGENLFFKNASRLAVGESPLRFINPKKVGRIAAIMPVHQLGMPCDIQAILTIARQHNLPVVEDAACALGSEVLAGETWERIGKPHADLACFSFHPRKVVTTGDGGMITTNNQKYDATLRLLRNHGMNISGAERKARDAVILEEYFLTGFNYRMTDIQASVGIAQLRRLPEFIKRRRLIDQWYRKYFKSIDWLELPFEPEYARANWQTYPARVFKNAPLSRDNLIEHLFDNDIASIPGVMNAHQAKPYCQQNYSLPNSENARKEVIILPFYVDLKEDDIKYIADVMAQLGTKV